MNILRNKRTLPALILSGIVVFAAVFFISRDRNETIDSTEAVDIPFHKQGELAFTDAASGDTLAIIGIEIADNDQRRARGLMFRRTLPQDAGMLFIQDAEEIQSFWMKNTYIPLDMVFVNADKEIVTIQANTAPLREWNYVSTKPALYVVEVNAGFCRRNGIEEGDKIGFRVN